MQVLTQATYHGHIILLDIVNADLTYMMLLYTKQTGVTVEQPAYNTKYTTTALGILCYTSHGGRIVITKSV